MRHARNFAQIILLLLASLAALAPARAQTTTVPMELRGVHLFVPVQINGKPATFVLDSGASDNVITPQAVERLGLKMPEGGNVVSVTGMGEAVGQSQKIQIEQLSVGDFTFNTPAFVLPLPALLNCDGILGAPLIGSVVTTIDYQSKTLRITVNKDFDASSAGTVLPLRFFEGLPYTKLQIGDYEGYFTVDTGSGRAVVLHTPFVDKNRLRNVYKPALTMVSGFGVGGLTKGDTVRLPGVALGNFKWNNVVGELSRQTKGLLADDFVQGTIGGQIWQRFTLTLDYQNGRAFVKANDSFNKPFDEPRSGMFVYEGKVVDVAPNTPAQEAGVLVGDKVLSVDGKLTDTLSIWDISAAQQQPAGTKVLFKLRGADGKEREVTVTLRDLI